MWTNHWWCNKLTLDMALGLSHQVSQGILCFDYHLTRECFSVPAAIPALLLAIFAIPRNFPNHGEADRHRTTWGEKFSKGSRAKVDIIGAALLLLATLSMTAGFEEADSRFPWKSAYVISLLSISGLLWVLLLLWERYITNHSTTIEPVLPWRFFTNRAMLSLLL